MGRVSVSESLMRSRHSSMPEAVANQDGILSQGRGASVPASSHNGRVSVVEGHHPRDAQRDDESREVGLSCGLKTRCSR